MQASLETHSPLVVSPIALRYGQCKMGRSNRIQTVAVLVICSLALFFAQATIAQELTGEAVGMGTVAAWLSGLGFEATLSGDIQWIGDALLGGHVVSFSADGVFDGFARRDILTLTSEGWIAYEASGVAENGEPIEIRGLLHTCWQSLLALQAGEIIVGQHHAVIASKGETCLFSGEFSGTAEGALEPSDTPGVIRFCGTATVHFEGIARGETASGKIPLDHPSLPAEFLQYVAELDLGV